MTNDSSIESAFQAAINSGKINGAIICANAGRFVYEKTLGQRTLLSGEKKEHQLDDVVFLASATKLMTAIATLACIEDGKLALTGDLSKIAPELTSKQVLTGFTDDGEPILEAPARPITLEMLLTHSSGVSYHFIDPKVMKWHQKLGGSQLAGPDAKLKVEEMCNHPLSYQPGTSFVCKSNNHFLLIAHATGGRQ
jgi:CubicO group peptidase (beta-lactamase class C family)